MIEECKEFEKQAKNSEKENPDEAVELYQRAAECFGNNEKPKDRSSNLEKGAKLLREIAKSKESPVDALEFYEKSSDIFNDITKTGEGDKVMQEAYKRFSDSVKLIRSEVKNSDDLEHAEQQLQIASEYALKAKDEQLSRECWIDSGDQYRQHAAKIENPREALDVYKHAIQNYRKGATKDHETTTWTDAAEKFNNKANEIYKTSKELVFALDNYIQASILYHQANSEERAQSAETKVHEICNTMGISKEYLTNYLESQNLNSVTLV